VAWAKLVRQGARILPSVASVSSKTGTTENAEDVCRDVGTAMGLTGTDVTPWPLAAK